MKTSRIAVLALLASAATGFNAFAADGSDNYQLPVPQKFVSTLDRAQVQSEAMQANLDNYNRQFSVERGTYQISAPAKQVTGNALTRDAVRAEAIMARSYNLHADRAG